jgi:hypothetical protein
MKTKFIGVILALAFGTAQAAFAPEQFKLDRAQELLDICTAPDSHPDYLEAYDRGFCCLGKGEPAIHERGTHSGGHARGRGEVALQAG